MGNSLLEIVIGGALQGAHFIPFPSYPLHLVENSPITYFYTLVIVLEKYMHNQRNDWSCRKMCNDLFLK